MNRKFVLLGNLVLLIGFAGGYAVAYFIAKKVESLAGPAASPVMITQPASPSEPQTIVKDAQSAPTQPAGVTTDIAALQAQLAEKNAKIAELQQKLASPTHDTVTPEEDTPEYREKLAGDLMELTRTKDMIQQSFKASAQIMGRDLTPEGQEALGQALNRIYGWDKMEKSFTRLYTEVFSAQELNDMAEFYRSDVGAAMLKKTPELMQKTTQMVQQINAESQPKVLAEVEAISKKHRLKTATK